VGVFEIRDKLNEASYFIKLKTSSRKAHFDTKMPKNIFN